MASKRKLEDLEVNDVELLKEPLLTASIHGVISGLSPIKKGRRSNYFEGTVSDGKAKVRLVGFSHSQQSKMKELMEKKQSIRLDDCEVKQARRGNKMEIMLKGTTTINVSPKIFDMTNIPIEEEMSPKSYMIGSPLM